MDNSAPAIVRLRVNLGAVAAGLRSSLERSPRDSQVGAPASHPRERWRWMLLTGAELLILLCWTLVVVRPYLNMDPTLIPSGREYGSAIQTHTFWIQLRECGVCALWNGNVRGGHPALVDPYGSFLHPLVAVTTLGWGVINGSKVALAGAFLMAGLAQWWLARELSLSWAARMWTAMLAVAAGTLAGRMEIGVFGIVLSTAACSLVFPALLRVNRLGTTRSIVILGITLALALVAGQGYMQIGLAFVLLAALLLLPWDRTHAIAAFRRYGLAVGLALCLGAIFLAPFIHFLPQFVKDTDPTFATAQPFAYVPVNLVIADHRFYLSDALSKLPYPYLYTNYVGWLPILLAILGLRGARDPWGRRVVRFLACAAFLALWLASAGPLRGLIKALPFPWVVDQVTGIRHPSLIAGLAVLPILGLAGIGLDWLLTLSWPKLRLFTGVVDSGNNVVSFDTRWILLVPLLMAILSAKSAGEPWLGTVHLDPSTAKVVDALRTSDLQWVNAPFGEHPFQLVAVEKGLKLASGIQTWNWKDRPYPEPTLEAHREGIPQGMTLSQRESVIPIYEAGSGREYASVTQDGQGRSICEATGHGGDIDVACATPQAGVLTVKENRWSGWHAEVDGKRSQLLAGQWLAVNLPAGEHIVRFRYRPWDVPLGLAITLMGAILALYLGLRPERKNQPSRGNDE